MTETKRAVKVKGGRVRVYPKLTPEEYERLTLLQREGETAAGVMLRALEVLWATQKERD